MNHHHAGFFRRIDTKDVRIWRRESGRDLCVKGTSDHELSQPDPVIEREGATFDTTTGVFIAEVIPERISKRDETSVLFGGEGSNGVRD